MSTRILHISKEEGLNLDAEVRPLKGLKLISQIIVDEEFSFISISFLIAF